MRILHVDTGRAMRGGQWQVFYLTRALVEAGHESVVLAPHGSPLYRETEIAGLPVQPLEFRRLLSAESRFDIVHAHTGKAHTLAVLASLRRLVVSRRVAFPVQRGCASRWKYARAASFIAVSEHVKSKLVAADVSEQRISVIHDGVPLLAQSACQGVAIAPATDDPRKGSSLARDAATSAGVKLDFSVNLRADLPEAGMFVYITEEEGLGSGVLLAMSAGVPVIASRVGGLLEIVEDGVNGLLTNNSVPSIVAAIRRIADDPEGAIRMGQCGRQTVETRFSIERLVSGTMRIYEKTLRN